MSKTIIRDGQNTTEALHVLSEGIKSQEALDVLADRAGKILEYSVDPVAGEKERTYGLLYGLIQSGKTSVITVTTAMAVDNGFQCVIILTSDINLLYTQTLSRIRSQLLGLPVLGKSDWNDDANFERYIRSGRFVIVSSKNTSHLNNLLEAFKKVGSKGARGLSTLIIDDEADQASLNTKTSRNAKNGTDELSSINRLITELRTYFDTDTFLQVTATPQALFLQSPHGLYRPSFTVLSEPGKGYVGGDIFFGSTKYLHYVDLEEIDELVAGMQPKPTLEIPPGLRTALLTFFVGATAENTKHRGSNYAFLCHISHKQVSQKHVVEVISAFHEKAVNALRAPGTRSHEFLVAELRKAYEDLEQTADDLPSFDTVLDRLTFLLPGASVKEINSTTEHEITLEHVFTILVGGNKLGRGVTIPNLITSYYGRNPKHPNSDTVLQHARMYGYRRKFMGVTRLFLPKKLADHFKIIHQMEEALRGLVSKHPTGQFEGIYIGNPLKATRSNVLDPTTLGIYTAGSNCSPRYPMRSQEATPVTIRLDEMLEKYTDENTAYEVSIDTIIGLIDGYLHDEDKGAELWDVKTLSTALEKLKSLKHKKAYLVVKRGRNLNEERRETQGFLSGGEANIAPSDAPALFIYRLNESPKGVPAWWPLIHFPEGNYALAFSFRD